MWLGIVLDYSFLKMFDKAPGSWLCNDWYVKNGSFGNNEIAPVSEHPKGTILLVSLRATPSKQFFAMIGIAKDNKTNIHFKWVFFALILYKLS